MPGQAAAAPSPIGYAWAMLTRAQVARRLGKSIATVRRLEGSQLHPRRDASGVFRFDEAEVSRLAAARGMGRECQTVIPSLAPAGRGARSEWFHARVDHEGAGCDSDSPDDVEGGVGSSEPCEPVAARKTRLLEARVRKLEDRLAQAGREESAACEQRRVQARAVRELLDELGSLSDAELRRLGPEPFAAITDLIAHSAHHDRPDRSIVIA
jgi:hypothetical protein